MLHRVFSSFDVDVCDRVDAVAFLMAFFDLREQRKRAVFDAKLRAQQEAMARDAETKASRAVQRRASGAGLSDAGAAAATKALALTGGLLDRKRRVTAHVGGTAAKLRRRAADAKRDAAGRELQRQRSVRSAASQSSGASGGGAVMISGGARVRSGPRGGGGGGGAASPTTKARRHEEKRAAMEAAERAKREKEREYARKRNEKRFHPDIFSSRDREGGAPAVNPTGALGFRHRINSELISLG